MNYYGRETVIGNGEGIIKNNGQRAGRLIRGKVVKKGKETGGRMVRAFTTRGIYRRRPRYELLRSASCTTSIMERLSHLIAHLAKYLAL